MEIINLTNKQQLNNFVGGQPHAQFLQSWQWGEFQEKVSGQVWRLGVLDNNELVASAKVITKNLPMGKKYFYCGRGPVVAVGADERQAVEPLFKEIEKLAGQAGIMFLRFDPLKQSTITNYQLSIVKTLDVQPSKTLILDLAQTEAELLKQMRQKTRYNINLAEKKGVSVVAADKTRFEEFWSLLDQTAGRDKFRLHGRNYYRAMLEINDNPVKLFFAQYQNRPIATALVCFFGDTATYLHGGSASEERNVMASYLLQWHNIKLAKQLGYKYYDWHGIDEVKWPGVTRFKIGFGGQVINYPGTFDLVYDTGWYSIYKMIRRVRQTF